MRRNGTLYETTTLGDFLAAQFRSLLDGVETMRKLRSVVQWLPTETFDFGLERFADAEITRPRPGVPGAPVRRAADLIRDSDRVRILARVPMILAVEAYPEAVSTGTRLEIVFSRDAMDVVTADRRMTERFEESLASGQVSAFRYDGSIPYILGVAFADDERRTGIGAVDDDGIPRGYVISGDEAIGAWAERTIDAYRNRSEPIDVSVFDP